MARVHIDVCAWGKPWFKLALSEIEKIDSVVFVESMDVLSARERERQVQIRNFLAVVSKKYGPHRVVWAPRPDMETSINFLSQHYEWCANQECDDPHVFSLAWIGGVRFVFTDEKRMDVCRKKLGGKIDKKYLKFRLVNSETNYQTHKLGVLR